MTEGLAVGIDLGGTQLRAALLTRDGTLVRRAATRTAALEGPPAVMAQMESLVGEVLAGRDPAGIVGLGICAPGPLDAQSGTVLEVSTLAGWIDIPLTSLIEQRLGFPTIIENDGIAAAIGEWRCGGGRGLTDFIYVTVSTGIGGGIVAGGRVLRGRQGLAGHIGHMLMEGASGGPWRTFEGIASGTAFGLAAAQAARDDPQSCLHGLGAAVDARAVFAAARSGDALALRLIDMEGDALAIGFINLLHIFSPAAILIGGGLANGLDLMEAAIRRRIRGSALKDFRDVPLVRNALGDDAGLAGMATLVFDRFAESGLPQRPVDAALDAS